jgi:hypothetical protein
LKFGRCFQSYMRRKNDSIFRPRKNIPYLRVAALFWQEFTLQNWCAAHTRNFFFFKKEPRSSEKKPLSYRRLSPWRRYFMLWNP